MESAEWIKANGISPHGHVGEHRNEKVWTMFSTSSRRLRTAMCFLKSLCGSACEINFLLFRIDRFFMDSFVLDSIQPSLPTICQWHHIFQNTGVSFQEEGLRVLLYDLYSSLGLLEEICLYVVFLY